MNATQYQKICNWFTARPAAYRLLKGLYRSSAVVVAVFYLALLCYQGCVLGGLFATGQDAAMALQDALVVVFVPAGAYLAGTVLRARLNYQRPYQQEGFTPLIPKQKQGHAFPSRHAVSASAIAATWWVVSPAVSVLLWVFVLVICVVRVLAGVHFIRDVVAGAAFGGFFGAFAILTLTGVLF